MIDNPTQGTYATLPVAVPIQNKNNITNYSDNLSTNSPNTTYSTTNYVETIPELPKLQICWRYGKTVKVFSIIDSVFCFLFSLYNPMLLFILLFPICGYYGAKHYNVNKCILYILYCIGIALVKIIQIYYVYTNLFSSDNKMNDTSSQVLLWISLLIQIWITWIVIKFTCLLHKLNLNELNTLRIGTYIPVVTSVVLY